MGNNKVQMLTDYMCDDNSQCFEALANIHEYCEISDGDAVLDSNCTDAVPCICVSKFLWISAELTKNGHPLAAEDKTFFRMDVLEYLKEEMNCPDYNGDDSAGQKLGFLMLLAHSIVCVGI